MFVKLPKGTKLRARVAQKAPISGFVPIKGVATVPIGSEIDSRKGQLDIKTASKFDKKGQRTQLQQGRFGAGIFKIRQAAKRRAGAAAKPSTDLVLQTPPGLSRACAAGEQGAADQGHRAHARRDRQGRVPRGRRRARRSPPPTAPGSSPTAATAR